jgi:alpha-tubulin suppressor-like RCC1 family protein
VKPTSRPLVWKLILVLVVMGASLAHESTIASPVSGNLMSWGFDAAGQLGDASRADRSVPFLLRDLGEVVAVGGYNYTLALKLDGTVWAWGDDSTGQLGDGGGLNRSRPSQIVGVQDITAIAGGEGHCLAVKADGTVLSWGINAFGQGGTGNTGGILTPYPIKNFNSVSAVAAGSRHSLALKSDGTVWAWGSDFFGQLGDGADGPNQDKYYPAQIAGLTGVVAIACGEDHSLALKSDGTVWAWGYNFSGQLGDNNTQNRKRPFMISSLHAVTAISAMADNSMVLEADGTVWTWGDNFWGQLGDGSLQDRHFPGEALGLSPAISVSVGKKHSLAAKADGTVWAWGSNSHRQLGNEKLNITATELADSPIPVQVTEIKGALKVFAGSYHSLAIVPAPVKIATAALPEGLVGAAYKQILAASGGFAPFTWTVDSGALPTGLSLDRSTGGISGIPTAAGTSSVTIRVSCSTGSDTVNLSLKVNPSLAASITSPASPQPTGPPPPSISQTTAPVPSNAASWQDSAPVPTKTTNSPAQAVPRIPPAPSFNWTPLLVAAAAALVATLILLTVAMRKRRERR